MPRVPEIYRNSRREGKVIGAIACPDCGQELLVINTTDRSSPKPWKYVLHCQQCGKSYDPPTVALTPAELT
jgi:transcription elongation factor Elf1